MTDELRPTTPSSPVPANASPSRALDRAALERVLARAAELQASAGDAGEPTMTESQLIDVGREVGLSVEHVRQAIAEERTRLAVPSEPGGAAGFFGPTRTWAQRTLRGTPAEILAALDSWMQREECLQIKRRFTDRITWEARRDLIGNIKRGFNVGGRGYALTRADEVGATVVAVDDERAIVRLDAEFATARRRNIGWGSIGLGLGVVGAGGLVTFAALIPDASMLVAGIVGGVWAGTGAATLAGLAQAHRRTVLRGQLALDQILDRLEHDELRRPVPPFIANVLGGLRIGR